MTYKGCIYLYLLLQLHLGICWEILVINFPFFKGYSLEISISCKWQLSFHRILCKTNMLLCLFCRWGNLKSANHICEWCSTLNSFRENRAWNSEYFCSFDRKPKPFFQCLKIIFSRVIPCWLYSCAFHE